MGKGSTEARGKHSIRRNSCRVVSLCPQWSVFHNASSAFSRSISPKWQLIGQLICKWPKCCLLLQSGQMRTSARQISSKLVADHRRMKHCWAQWPKCGNTKVHCTFTCSFSRDTRAPEANNNYWKESIYFLSSEAQFHRVAAKFQVSIELAKIMNSLLLWRQQHQELC